MKKMITLASGLLLLAFTASAQIGTVAPSGIVHKPFTTNTGPIALLGSMLTNFTAQSALILPIPASSSVKPFGVYIRTGGTNSSDTTNLTFTFEGLIYTSSGVTQVVDNQTWTVSTPTTATSLPTGYDYYTNFWGGPTVLYPPNLQGLDGIRIRSINQTNTGTIWLSNFFMVYKEL